jgi:hypothetical protein
MPRESCDSRFPDRRANEELLPRWLRSHSEAGSCSGSVHAELFAFAPGFLGESGPFCPICFELPCWRRPLSAPAVFHFPGRSARGFLPTRNSGRFTTLKVVQGEAVYACGVVGYPRFCRSFLRTQVRVKRRVAGQQCVFGYCMERALESATGGRGQNQQLHSLLAVPQHGLD